MLYVINLGATDRRNVRGWRRLHVGYFPGRICDAHGSVAVRLCLLPSYMMTLSVSAWYTGTTYSVIMKPLPPAGNGTEVTIYDFLYLK